MRLVSAVEYLLHCHSDQLRSITLSPDAKLHYALFLDYAELMDADPPLARLVFANPIDYLRFFDQAAILAHKKVLKDMVSHEKGVEKKFIHVRFNVCGSPLEFPETFPRIGCVRVKHRGILLTLKGTVIRSGAVKMYEGERTYQCKKCKHMFPLYPELETRNKITLPSVCPSQRSNPCEGSKFICVENTTVCHDYQEIKIQESTQVLGVGVIPRSILVILQDDLVDIVKAGDDVIVTGILTAKWSPDLKDVRCDLDPILIANHVRRTNELKLDIDIPDDVCMKFKQFWLDFRDTPLKGRNAILRGICPQVFGLFTVKLAVALTLIGGVQHVDASGTKIRGESHLLLVGDPGTGKSQFLKFAAKLSNRSVITTGLGSTSAGLTVAAVKDGGEWMLEAGALVLADGGLCCIDEFDSMREHDRATIHEAMEQQTISVAKAGLVTTLIVSSHILGEGEYKNGKQDEDLANIWPLSNLRWRSATHNAARTTVRMLESLIRLAQAHARLMFRNEVTRLDAIAAILCIESSMTISAIIDSIGNAMHSNFTENPDQEYAKQEKIILEKLSLVDESQESNGLGGFC
ncbi:putative DNA helicase MCM9 [Hibiscus syriacus]|uniref:DNA helicase n=1 Tax=Hibiscus syriacus TaxID=106335 RepID=A0A6A3AV05_HIBSY|nr:putative DNA helicase MCM9 [Hibiscus syriacus]